MRDNKEILAARLEAFNARSGARVGDYLRLPKTDPRCPEFTRFTHNWGDVIQTGGSEYGQYYLGNGAISYSGSLDPGIATDQIRRTDEAKLGSVWFFDGDLSGAGRGVNFTVPFRVFVPIVGAKLDGIGELRCPYGLSVLSPEQHAKTCGYWFTVTKNVMACTAFALESELRAWLAKEKLALTKPIALDTPSYQTLAYIT